MAQPKLKFFPNYLCVLPRCQWRLRQVSRKRGILTELQEKLLKSSELRTWVEKQTMLEWRSCQERLDLKVFQETFKNNIFFKKVRFFSKPHEPFRSFKELRPVEIITAVRSHVGFHVGPRSQKVCLTVSSFRVCLSRLHIQQTEREKKRIQSHQCLKSRMLGVD